MMAILTMYLSRTIFEIPGGLMIALLVISILRLAAVLRVYKNPTSRWATFIIKCSTVGFTLSLMRHFQIIELIILILIIAFILCAIFDGPCMSKQECERFS